MVCRDRRVENEDREPDQTLLASLESYSRAAVGANWGALLDSLLIANLGKYRRYDFTSLRDLLRVIRNKRNHFREMPESLQAVMAPIPDGFYRWGAGGVWNVLQVITAPSVVKMVPWPYCRYFDSRFPNLLMSMYVFTLHNLGDDLNLGKYWSATTPDELLPFARMFSHHHPAAGKQATPPRTPGNGKLGRPVQTPPAAAAPAAVPMQEASGGAVNGLIVGYQADGAPEPLHYLDFPQRPGKQPCDFYTKTGYCRFQTSCCFDHPTEFAVPLTELELPYRPEQPICAFYLKAACCKFGPSCKFHHPKLVPVYAGSGMPAHQPGFSPRLGSEELMSGT